MEKKGINGYKTYIMCAATIAYAIGGVIIGKVDYSVAVPLVMGALGGASLRHGIK